MNNTNGINVLIVKDATINLTVIAHCHMEKNVFTNNLIFKDDMDDNILMNP